MSKPPLGLMVEVTTLDGTRHQWGHGDSNAGNIPQGLGFRTKRGDGFADSGVTLSRRIDRDYVDIQLLAEVAYVGEDGSVAYEGRVTGNPRVLDLGHSMQVPAAGWMSHAKDRKFTEIYVDRDLGHWHEPPLVRRVQIVTGSDPIGGVNASSSRDGLVWEPTQGQALAVRDTTELHYDAGVGLFAAKVMYKGARTGTWTNMEAATLYGDDQEIFSGVTTVGLTLDDTLRTASLSSPQQYLMLRTYVSTGFTPADAMLQRYSLLAVYGDHGLTTHGIDSEPDGVYASDVIRHIAGKWCPLLNTNGVQNTTYPIGHLAFLDRTFPYDAFLAVNRPHRWGLEVWENKTLSFAPTDLTDYDWEVRLTDPGTRFEPVGDTIGELANGIVVTYTDVQSGTRNTVTPDDDSALEDTNPDNPANLAGYPLWQELELSWPCTRNDAVQIGRAALAEFNRPKMAGTIKLQGHVRDRGGNWQPVWKVRAGQRLVIADHPNDVVRLIQETSYSADNHECQLSMENPAQRIDAVFDRITDALAANGLS